MKRISAVTRKEKRKNCALAVYYIYFHGPKQSIKTFTCQQTFPNPQRPSSTPSDLQLRRGTS